MPPEAAETPQKSIGREILEIARVLLISLAIVLPIRFFVAQPFIVRGASMEPNFQYGEYLVVDELSYRFRAPNRDDVIILRYPKDPKEFFIKRIIGLPGETIVIKDGGVYIEESGSTELRRLNEPYIGSGVVTVPNIRVMLGADEYFVLGDNRPHSSDSRVWGVLKSQFVIGRALLRLWPLSHAAVF